MGDQERDRESTQGVNLSRRRKRRLTSYNEILVECLSRLTDEDMENTQLIRCVELVVMAVLSNRGALKMDFAALRKAHNLSKADMLSVIKSLSCVMTIESVLSIKKERIVPELTKRNAKVF